MRVTEAGADASPGTGARRVKYGLRHPGARRRDSREQFEQCMAVVRSLTREQSDDACDRLRAHEPSPVVFLAFVEEHRLGWYVDEAIRPADLIDVLPSRTSEQMRTATDARLAKHQRLTSELVVITTAFRERGLEPILFKGPHLARRIPRLARRPFWDLDLLVPVEDVGAAEQTLTELGYARDSSALGLRQLTMRFAHGFDFRKGPVGVDLHWSLGSHVSYRIDYEGIGHRRTTMDLNDGVAIGTLGDEDVLFVLLLSLFEDIERGAARVRAFVELDAVLDELASKLDWPLFWRARQEDRTARLCRHTLALLIHVLDARDRFRDVAGATETQAEYLRQQPEIAWRLLNARRGALFNKQWAFSIYEAPRCVNVAWWGVSLPFRFAVYNRGKFRRFKYQLRRFGG